MAPRARWKGHLKLSLVACPVALYTATTTSNRIRLNILNRNTGNRVQYDVVDADTGEAVEEEDRVKGYRVDRGAYVVLEDEDLQNVALESTHTIDIEAFIPRAEVDDLYLDESYYIAPADKVGAEAFAVIREAMAREKLVGLARVVLSRREQILMLEPRGNGMMATSLRYAEEVRGEDAYFDDIPDVKVSSDMLDLAIHILKSKKSRFDPAKFEDRYEAALDKLIKAKRSGKEIPAPTAEAPSNVISLMDALRRSVEKRGGGKTDPEDGDDKAAGGRSAKPAAKTTRKPSAKSAGKSGAKSKAKATGNSTGKSTGKSARGGQGSRLKKAS